MNGKKWTDAEIAEFRQLREATATPTVRPLLAGDVSPSVFNHTHKLDNALRDAIQAAKFVGVPQGFIVALLHAHAARETSQLLE